MSYRIESLDTFTVIGQEIELTNSKSKNMKLSIPFWRQFNAQLKKAKLSQSGHWLKYAFMYRHVGKLYYYCAIPKKDFVPIGFIERTVASQIYMVVEHVGQMSRIYKTYDRIYNEILPNSGYQVKNDIFLHFEKYDNRFHWNQVHSIIEIWVPIYKKEM